MGTQGARGREAMVAAIGSTNPVKVAAAREVLRRVYGRVGRVEGLDVESGVGEQPWGDEETLRGALSRAEAALEAVEARLGVGMEAGLVEVGGDVFICAWCVILHRDGRRGVAGGANLLLPPRVARLVRDGAELGPAMDALTGLDNTKEGPGAIGILTRGHLDRQSSYEHLLTLAMARLLAPEYYEEDGNGG